MLHNHNSIHMVEFDEFCSEVSTEFLNAKLFLSRLCYQNQVIFQGFRFYFQYLAGKTKTNLMVYILNRIGSFQLIVCSSNIAVHLIFFFTLKQYQYAFIICFGMSPLPGGGNCPCEYKLSRVLLRLIIAFIVKNVLIRLLY